MFVGGWLGVFDCKIETKKLSDLSWAVDWLHGWWLPSLLSWWVVGCLVLGKRLTECWLTVGGWLGVFDCNIETKKLTDLSWAVDWLHGWRLPSLLSWSVVVWLVLAKRLLECWLTVGWWVAWCFFTAKSRQKTDWLVLSSWLNVWLSLGNQIAQFA